MATTTLMVDKYKVYHWTPRKAKRLDYSITVELYYGASHVGTLHFYPDGFSPLPSDALYIQSRGHIIYLKFYENQYRDVIDLLRNEKPVWISISAKVGSPGDYEYGEGEIRTDKEPVGEEEGP